LHRAVPLIWRHLAGRTHALYGGPGWKRTTTE
jgi:hypothetical protein